MNLETVILSDGEYFVLEKIEMNNSLYYLLINVENNTDFCIRKKIMENNVEYFVGLDTEEEFTAVLQKSLNQKNRNHTTKFLPIGTIIKLYDYDKKVMILGYMMMGKNDRIYEYCGCDYPMGILNKKNVLYFDRQNIVEISKLGYMDEETIQILKKVELASMSNSIL